MRLNLLQRLTSLSAIFTKHVLATADPVKDITRQQAGTTSVVVETYSFAEDRCLSVWYKGGILDIVAMNQDLWLTGLRVLSQHKNGEASGSVRNTWVQQAFHAAGKTGGDWWTELRRWLPDPCAIIRRGQGWPFDGCRDASHIDAAVTRPEPVELIVQVGGAPHGWEGRLE